MNELTDAQKNELFTNVILNNAPNKFVYNQLRQTLVDNPSIIVPFVGAGLSQFAYKAWGALLQDLLDQLGDSTEEKKSKAEIQKKIDCGNFFEAADELENLIQSDVFFFSLVSACNESKLIKDDIPDTAAVRWIPRVFPDSRIITTNYDCVLELAYAKEKRYLRVCTPSDSRMFMQFMPRRLFKIHGSYDSNYEDIVLTSKSYSEKYKKGSPLYNNFKHIVQSSILLFLGASLRSDKTLDILKEIATELTIGGHYCGNMHYAVVNIKNDEDKIQRRKELAEFKILPILYTENDHSSFTDKHAIVSVILEKLYDEITAQMMSRTSSLGSTTNDEKIHNGFTENKNSSENDKKIQSSFYDNKSDSDSSDGISNAVLSMLLRQDPIKAFAVALKNHDIKMAESMLGSMEKSTPHEVYLTKVLPALASLGSEKASRILFDSLSELRDSKYSPAQIIDIAGSLVSYCNRRDVEKQYADTITHLLESVLDRASEKEQANIYNQYSRLFYGAYSTDNSNTEFRDLAYKNIEKAIELDDTIPGYFYNKAILLERDERIEEAKEAIKRCIECGTDDLDHLELAYRLYRKTNDTKSAEILKQIKEIDSAYSEFVETSNS